MISSDKDEHKGINVLEVYQSFPEYLREKALFLRQLILETASENDDIEEFEETLRWGEPSYISKKGSTIRICWSKSHTPQYAMYFHCKTKLIDTFREVYRDKFSFEGNRAIVFNVSENVPVKELKHCIYLSLVYHKIKHKNLLGL